MRTTSRALLAALGLAAAAACTVKDVDTPQLAGPSGLSRAITMTTDRDTLTQNGEDTATITIRSQVQPGQPDAVRLRAAIIVDGAVQDYGTLSSKNPIATANGTTITYRAPAASNNAATQVATTVTIAVTPDDSGDFRGEVARQLDIRLIPPGVILPNNPNLVANFTFVPAAPQIMQTVTFDASTSTNNGTACGILCTYAWSFGDGTSGSGITTTHQYRSVGSVVATLTVTDARGATATRSQTIGVAAGTPPTMAAFTTSPATPGVGQDIFFNASASATPAAGRTITGYEWLFGDGNSGRGVVVTHRYEAPGQYTIQLAATDDAGSVGRITQTLQVGPTVGATPTATLSFTPASPKAGSAVSFNASLSRPGAGSNIQSYTFNWGDGSPEDVVTNPLQTHTYTAAGTFVATLTVTDTMGRTATAQVTVTVTP